MANKRFNQITRVVTSFDSNDVLPIGNGTLGDGKMPKDTLLKLTAQNALAGNEAPAFDPTRTSDNPYKANTPILYNGKLYFFKVDHYGAWDVSDVYSIPLTEKYLDEVFLEFEYKRGYHRVDLEYVGDFVEDNTYYTVKTSARVGDKFFITGQGAAAAQLWATYDKDGKIVRRAGGTNTYKLYEDFFVVTIEDGEAGIVFNSHFFIGRFTFRLLNLSSIVSRLNEETKRLIEHDKLIFEYEFIRRYRATAGSGIVGWYYRAPASEFSVKLTKVSGPAMYDIWMNDSTGVLSNVQYKTNLSFDSIVDVAMVDGYDRIFFFAQGVPGVAVDVTAYRVYKGTLEYRVEILENSEPYSGKKVVCLGDSITQFKYNGKGYCDYLKDLIHADVVNGGIGGTRYSVRATPTTTPTTSAEAWAGLDMYNLVKSWCENDWSTVDASVEWLHNHEDRDYSGIVTRLKNNPVSSIDVVTLFAGTNDWNAGVAKGSVSDNSSGTLLGALSLIVQKLFATKSNLKIFVFSPIVRWIDYSGMATSDIDKFSDTMESSGVTLKNYASYIIDGALSLKIPVCDLYNSLGWNQYNFSAYFFDTDGTHPYKGFGSLAKRMNGFLIANNW